MREIPGYVPMEDDDIPFEGCIWGMKNEDCRFGNGENIESMNYFYKYPGETLKQVLNRGGYENVDEYISISEDAPYKPIDPLGPPPRRRLPMNKIYSQPLNLP